MAVHVAILLPRYIRLILDGAKTVESRLTIQDRPPYKRVTPGDRIYFKASGGAFEATAIAAKVEYHHALTPAKVDALKRRHNSAVRGDDQYWAWKRDSRYATFIKLRDVEATDRGPALPPSQGIAWFTLADDAAPRVIDLPITAGGLRNGYVKVLPASDGAFPGDAYTTRASKGDSPSRTVELLLPAGERVRTDIDARRRMFRWRGWRRVFEQANARAGDVVRLERLDHRHYRVGIMKKNVNKPSSDLALDASATGDGDAQRKPGPRSRPAVAPASSRAATTPDLRAFISPRELATLVRVARREDLGPKHRDVTSELLIPRDRTTSAVFVARTPGVLAGAALLPAVVKEYDASVQLTPHLADGSPLKKGDRIAELRGSLRSVLAIERVALNFLTHLSGIASLTRRYADAVAGTKAGVYDTRKTHAGLRALEKYAVVCGGGRSHRMGLYDAVLVKDNHLAHIPLDALAAELGAMIAKAREARPRLKFVQIEVDRLEQLERVLPLRPDIVLLDNMPPEVLSKAVAMRDRVAPGVELEASGGVNLDTVGAIARTGVDRISAGALTHSATALDIALDIAE